MDEFTMQTLAAVFFVALVGKFTKSETRTYSGALVVAVVCSSIAAPSALVAWGMLAVVLKGLDVVRGFM